MRQRLNDTLEATVLGPFRPESPLSAVLLEASGLETLTKLPWPAAPGERVAVAPIESDPGTGFYRLSVIGELDSPARAARLAAAEAEAEAGAAAQPEAGGGAEGAGEGLDMEAVWAMVDAQRRGGEEGEQPEDGGGDGDGGGGASASAAAAAAACAVAAAQMAAAFGQGLGSLLQG